MGPYQFASGLLSTDLLQSGFCLLQDELGSPLNPSWKQFPGTQNGYKLPSASATTTHTVLPSSGLTAVQPAPSGDTQQKPVAIKEQPKDEEQDENLTPQTNGLDSQSDLNTLEEVIQVRRVSGGVVTGLGCGVYSQI